MWANAQHEGRTSGRDNCCLTNYFPIVNTCLSCEDI